MKKQCFLSSRSHRTVSKLYILTPSMQIAIVIFSLSLSCFASVRPFTRLLRLAHWCSTQARISVFIFALLSASLYQVSLLFFAIIPPSSSSPRRALSPINSAVLSSSYLRLAILFAAYTSGPYESISTSHVTSIVLTYGISAWFFCERISFRVRNQA